MNSEKSRILIVDDSSFNIIILGEALSGEFEVSVATNGEDALATAMGPNQPDLVLLDIIMPGIDGHEVCRRLKSDASTASIPVIFITSMSEVEDETRGLELGAVDYITKPFSIPIVKARVRSHVELKRQRDILRDLSTLDGLTGIPNRRRFDEFFNLEWLRGRRSQTQISMVMADIDHFKAYNDNYGHAEGDECLRKVARAMKDCIKRPSDLLARYGGEEFAVILPETESQGAQHLAEALRAAVDSLNIPHAHSPVADHVTISVGVATLTPGALKEPEFLIKKADAMLYKAKNNGRNQVQVDR
ncbi:MAG: PleD family two-component system response regulator [Proteobacteria bacterium]|nr:PleD family two-component system response regulator [Pseudomonadota bacterium]